MNTVLLNDDESRKDEIDNFVKLKVSVKVTILGEDPYAVEKDRMKILTILRGLT